MIVSKSYNYCKEHLQHCESFMDFFVSEEPFEKSLKLLPDVQALLQLMEIPLLHLNRPTQEMREKARDRQLCLPLLTLSAQPCILCCLFIKMKCTTTTLPLPLEVQPSQSCSFRAQFFSHNSLLIHGVHEDALVSSDILFPVITGVSDRD